MLENKDYLKIKDFFFLSFRFGFVAARFLCAGSVDLLPADQHGQHPAHPVAVPEPARAARHHTDTVHHAAPADLQSATAAVRSPAD